MMTDGYFGRPKMGGPDGSVVIARPSGAGRWSGRYQPFAHERKRTSRQLLAAGFSWL